MTLAIKVFGVDDCLAAFRELPMTVQNKGMRIGLNAGAGIIRDAAVANAPKETGLLKRSLKIKVKVPNASYNAAHHGKPAYAVIGPSRAFVGVQTYRKSGAKGKVKIVREDRKRFITMGKRIATSVRRASRYAHLVEKGTKRGVAATRFLARAVASQGEAAKAKVIEKINVAISEWAARRSARALQAIGA